eukprot:TRINITY_DN7371_c0_g1_i1.p2 TRINITY_DN7371_c0_g1~~TRINITY_DN7371_c0_g1_i1.p2  ORF type:complete len:124 (+),score=36.33 TRINITY_DN7371_c0_g1_i1:39-374(+)
MSADVPKEAQACVLASLILHDDGVPVTSEAIIKITDAAGVKVPPVWANLFVQLFENKKIDELILSGGGGGAAAAPAAAAGGDAAAAGGKKEKEPEPEEEEEEEGGLGDLFG